MPDKPGVVGLGYDVLKILVLLSVYTLFLSLGTVGAVLGRCLERVRASGASLARRWRTRRETSSRP